MLSLPVLSLLLTRGGWSPSSMLLRAASWWSAWRWRREVIWTWWCCLHRRRRRGWNVGALRCSLHVRRIIMVGRSHGSWCSRSSSSITILVLRGLLMLLLHQGRVRIGLRTRSQAGIGRIVLRVVQEGVGVGVSRRHTQVALACVRSRWSVQVFSSKVANAPITSRSLSRARAHF